MAVGTFWISSLGLAQIYAATADFMFHSYMAGGTCHILTANTRRHMDIFCDCGVLGAQAHVTTFGPVTAAGLGMTAQTGGLGWFMDVLGQGFHSGSRRHERKVGHRCIVAERVLFTKDV